jgi:A118 family predicted phage portal protein
VALPASNTEWPPRQLAPAFEKMAEYDAWYSGDPDRLSSVYSRERARVRNRPSQYRGGAVGTVARWFWGAPTPQGEPEQRLHIAVAGDLARTSSDLLFAEPPSFRLDDGTPAALPGTGKPAKAAGQDRLDEILDAVNIDAKLAEAGEVAGALGGVYLRAGWDVELAQHPLLTAIHADCALPEFRMGILTAVTFVTVLSTSGDGQVVRRLVERHERGVQLTGLYEGKPGNLGKQLPLSADPATEGLSEQVNIPGGKLAVAYVPNMLPNRLHRDSPLGMSDLAGCEGPMDRFDMVYTSWMRDVELGKGRLLVPSSYITNLGPGAGAAFDPDRRIYEQLSIPPNSVTADPIKIVQFQIRVADHRDTARELLGRIISTAGYSEQTFGLADDGIAATATEITARERKSMTTRKKKINYWRPALSHIVSVLLDIDAAIFGGKVTGRVLVDWPPAVSDSPLVLAQTAQALRTADAASDETIVQAVHPDWDADRVRAEAAAIGAARQAATPLPDPLAGLPA